MYCVQYVAAYMEEGYEESQCQQVDVSVHKYPL